MGVSGEKEELFQDGVNTHLDHALSLALCSTSPYSSHCSPLSSCFSPSCNFPSSYSSLCNPTSPSYPSSVTFLSPCHVTEHLSGLFSFRPLHFILYVTIYLYFLDQGREKD